MRDRLHVVFVSGLSGSGKTTAMHALEDRSFYCVDNLPAQLTRQFLDLCAKSTPPIEKVALALDAREAAFLRGIPEVLQELRESGARVQLIYLDCAEEPLLNRYRETRRVHPLSPDGPVEAGIARERALLEDVAALADLRIDTSEMNVHQLRETVGQALAGERRPTVVNVVSFGFRFGIPPAAELLFDVRFLPNPHFEAALRPLSGEDPAVADYVLSSPLAVAFLERLRDLLAFLLPLYEEEGKAYLTVGVGCTGGRHRSVAVANRLAAELRNRGRDVNLAHRDVEKRT